MKNNQTSLDKPDASEALVVLGMHRSGTSALAGIFEIFGATAPKNQIKAGAQNERGFFEAARIARLNDRLLDVQELTWDSYKPHLQDGLSTEATSTFFAAARDVLVDEFGDAPLIALKDPRMCRLMPFWKNALEFSGRRPFFVLTLRNPLEVAQSLEVRNKIKPELGTLLWMTYVLEAEADTRGLPRVFTSFDQILVDPMPMLEKVHKMLDRPMPVDMAGPQERLDGFLSRDLRHHDVASQDNVPPRCQVVFDILTRWAQSGEDAADYPLLDLTLRDLHAVTKQNAGADELHDVLTTIEQTSDGPSLAAHLKAAEKMLKPELVAQNRALLRANAALSTQRGDAGLEQTELMEQLRQSIHSQGVELTRKSDAIATRDKDLAALGQLFAAANTEAEELRAALHSAEDQANVDAKEIRTLSAANKELHKDLKRLPAENTELHALVAKVESKRARLQAENTELHALVAKVENKRKHLQDENTELHGLVAQVETARHALISSTSWRLSRPIRWVGKLGRVLRR